jgi:hypothetical protein
MNRERLIELADRAEAGEFRALSIRQPYPHHIFHNGKDVETATGRPKGADGLSSMPVFPPVSATIQKSICRAVELSAWRALSIALIKWIVGGFLASSDLCFETHFPSI